VHRHAIVVGQGQIKGLRPPKCTHVLFRYPDLPERRALFLMLAVILISANVSNF